MALDRTLDAWYHHDSAVLNLGLNSFHTASMSPQIRIMRLDTHPYDQIAYFGVGCKIRFMLHMDARDVPRRLLKFRVTEREHFPDFEAMARSMTEEDIFAIWPYLPENCDIASTMNIIYPEGRDLGVVILSLERIRG